MKRVKCPYCEQYFDADSVAYVMIKKRYIHQNCYNAYQEKQKIDQLNRDEHIDEYHELFDWAKVHFDKPNYGLIGKQVKQYIKDGMKYESILKVLSWYYDICRNDISKAKGIGIVPLEFSNAKRYYKHLWELSRDAKNNSGIIDTNEIHIKPPKRNPYRPNKFDFLDEEVENDK